MGAGVPDWQKLYAMGKLPDHAKKFIPGALEAEEYKKKLDKEILDYQETVKKTLTKQLCPDCKKKIFGTKDEENEA